MANSSCKIYVLTLIVAEPIIVVVNHGAAKNSEMLPSFSRKATSPGNANIEILYEGNKYFYKNIQTMVP